MHMSTFGPPAQALASIEADFGKPEQHALPQHQNPIQDTTLSPLLKGSTKSRRSALMHSFLIEHWDVGH